MNAKIFFMMLAIGFSCLPQRAIAPSEAEKAAKKAANAARRARARTQAQRMAGLARRQPLGGGGVGGPGVDAAQAGRGMFPAARGAVPRGGVAPGGARGRGRGAPAPFHLPAAAGALPPPSPRSSSSDSSRSSSSSGSSSSSSSSSSGYSERSNRTSDTYRQVRERFRRQVLTSMDKRTPRTAAAHESRFRDALAEEETSPREIAKRVPGTMRDFQRDADRVQRAVVAAGDLRAKYGSDAEFRAHRDAVRAEFGEHAGPALTRLRQIAAERREMAARRADDEARLAALRAPAVPPPGIQ